MLSDIQKRTARYSGGKEIANRKAHLARTKTALLEISNGAGNLGNLIEGLSTAEREALRTAVFIVASLEATLARDVAEAKRIKATWDARHTAAMKALHTLPQARIEDQIALAELARELDTYQAQRLLRTARKYRDPNYVLQDMVRDAIASLAHQAANEADQPAAWCSALRADMPAAAAKHTDLIAHIKAIAVEKRIQETA